MDIGHLPRGPERRITDDRLDAIAHEIDLSRSIGCNPVTTTAFPGDEASDALFREASARAATEHHAPP